MPESSNRLSRIWQEFKGHHLDKSLVVYHGKVSPGLDGTDINFPKRDLPDRANDLVLNRLNIKVAVIYLSNSRLLS